MQDVPVSVTVITQQEIRDADITTLSGISANTPNFTTFTPNRNFVLYSIRGLSNFNFLSRDPVAFYVDDIPYDYTGFLDLDLTDLEQVEVLRGPQSTLYGRNAQAGVVNIITRKPTDEFTFNSTVGYSNYNDLDLRAAGGGPLVIVFVGSLLAGGMSGFIAKAVGYQGTFLISAASVLISLVIIARYFDDTKF